jgi:hypothetical protein
MDAFRSSEVITTPSGMPECRNAGMPECRNAGMPECRNAGMPECRNAGMPECRNAGMLALLRFLIYLFRDFSFFLCIEE